MQDMRNTLITLAEIHYEFGFIGCDERNERISVALWLADETEDHMNDPRNDSEDDSILNEKYEYNDSVIVKPDDGGASQQEKDDNSIEFLCLGLWVFTKADPDSYPSVPHGHFKSKDRKWPKLNPYTGRVFKSKHQEDKNNRFTKKQMKIIWSDEKFKSFCREMIIWYQEQFPYYEFPVPRPLRMPRW